MSAYGLHAGSQTPDFVWVLDQIYAGNVAQTNEIQVLQARVASMKEGSIPIGKKEWTELNSFPTVEVFDGNEKDFGNWEFKL